MEEQKTRKEECVLPFYGVSFEKQMEILKGFYVKSNKGERGVSYKEVSEIVTVSETNVSGCIKFYKAIGFLIPEQETGKYIPAEMLCNYFKILSYSDSMKEKENEAKNILRSYFKDIWFGVQVRHFLEIKDTADRNGIIVTLLEKVSEDMNENNRKSANILVEWLVYSGYLLKDETDNLKLNEQIDEIEMPMPASKRGMVREKVKGEEIERVEEKVKPLLYSVHLNITITPETTKEQLEYMIKIVKEQIRKEEEEH